MGTTNNYNIPYPEPTDFVAQGAAAIEAVATGFDTVVQAVEDSVPLELDDLDDVDAPTPSDGQVLTYNNTSGNWEAATPVTVGVSLGLVIALGG